MTASKQGRQDKNLQPSVLETDALPVEPRPSGSCRSCAPEISGPELELA